MRRRIARVLTRARRDVEDLRSTRRTVYRLIAERPPPPVRSFRRYGDNSWIVPPTEVVGEGNIEIGSNVVMLEWSSLRCSAAGSLRIGNGARFGRCVDIVCTDRVEIADDVSTSDYVTITDTFGPPPASSAGARLPSPMTAPVVIERGAYLGCLSAIGPGVRVGAGAFVGEGAVVVTDVEPHTVVYGNPAEVVRRWDAERKAWIGERFP